MNIFKIDFKRLVRIFIPSILRKPEIISFIEVLISPIRYVYNLFLVNRNSNLYRLGITPQVCYLEKLLNDRFDSDARRIYISDGVFYENEYIYTEDEDIDLYIFTQSENMDEYIYTGSESGSESADFIVNIPTSLQFNNLEFRALLNNYKLASKTYAFKFF